MNHRIIKYQRRTHDRLCLSYMCSGLLIGLSQRQAAEWLLHDSRRNIARAENGKPHRSCSSMEDGLVVEIDGGMARRTMYMLMIHREKTFS